MNATEFDRDLRILTDELGEKYIKLKDLEWAGHKDNEVKEMLYYGHIARVVARRIQGEFFPMAENSEEIIMTLLNQKFWYEGVDYSDEVNKMAVNYADVGLFLYVSYALKEQIETVEELIGDEVESRIF